MKIYERVIDNRIRSETEISEEQFGFMPGRSTTDAVFALRQLVERFREKKRDIHFVFIDLEKAYDRVPREEIWRCMREKGTPEKYVRIVQDMYEGAKTKIRSSVGETGSIPVGVGLHQASALSPYLFDLVIDVVSQGLRDSAPWCMMFADDVVLAAESAVELSVKLEAWRKALEDRGIRISRTKTVHLHMNFGSERSGEETRVMFGDQRLNKVEKFKYLGSTLNTEGSLESEIGHRISAGWCNWRKISGVLCDRKISLRVKGKMYKSVVRPALMYGGETWGIKKTEEKRMEVTEMKMLRWMSGVTRLDRIRNEVIRGKVKVVEISKKLQERRLQWLGHVERRDKNYVGWRVREIEVAGGRKRGRPEKTWKSCVIKDMREKGVSLEDAQDRDVWKRLVKNVDPA